jgi:hypothetical protein
MPDRIQGRWRKVLIKDLLSEFVTRESEEMGEPIEMTISGNSIEIRITQNGESTVIQRSKFKLWDFDDSGIYKMDSISENGGIIMGIIELRGTTLRRALALRPDERPKAFGETWQRYSVWERVRAGGSTAE